MYSNQIYTHLHVQFLIRSYHVRVFLLLFSINTFLAFLAG